LGIDGLTLAAGELVDRDRTLTVLSLISIALMAFHLTADFVLGVDKGAASPVGVLILAVWLTGTLVLTGTRWGYAIMLLGGLMATAMPILHFRGGVRAAIAESAVGLFWIWGLFAIGAAGSVAAILAALGLWRPGLRRSGTA
jgi:hypothetical protein